MCKMKGTDVRWVSYTRISSGRVTDDQQPGCIARQNDRIAEFMNQNGWTVCKKYIDRENSDTASNGLDQMIQDGLKREFGGVVFDSVYRCGRNIWIAEEILRDTFFPAGIYFAFADDSFCSIEKTNDEISEYFNRKVVEYRGEFFSNRRTTRIRQGEMPYQLARYGLLLSEDRRALEIEDEGAAVIRRIFQMCLNGMGYAQIAADLNQQEIMSPRLQVRKARGQEILKNGKTYQWSTAEVRNILNDRIYAGHAQYTIRGEMFTCSVPAIVSEQAFEAAQEKLEEIKRPKRKQSRVPETTLMRGLVFQKETGETLQCLQDRRGERRVNFIVKKGHDWQKIPFDTMMFAVRNAVRTAAGQAGYAEKLLKDGNGEILKEAEIDTLRREAQTLFVMLNDLYVQRVRLYEDQAESTRPAQEEKVYRETLSDYENRFQEIMDETERIQKVYSDENPWIRLYHNVEVPEKLEKKHIKKWIDSVTVDLSLNIEVKLKETGWMRRLPEEWLEEGAKQDGT